MGLMTYVIQLNDNKNSGVYPTVFIISKNGRNVTLKCQNQKQKYGKRYHGLIR